MIRDVKDNNSNLQALVSNPEPLWIIHSWILELSLGTCLIGKHRAPEHREIGADLDEASLQILFSCY